MSSELTVRRPGFSIHQGLSIPQEVLADKIIGEIFTIFLKEQPRETASLMDRAVRYLPAEDQALIRAYLALLRGKETLPSFVDFSAGDNVLKSHLPSSLHSKNSFYPVAAVAELLYQAQSRPVRGSINGQVFAMNPEVLSYLMKQAKDQVVVELAGANGLNAMLLAAAGAKHVYMNDLSTKEMEDFAGIKRQLPAAVSSRLEGIPGDCLDVLTKKPALRGTVDTILCQNLIHFFNDKQKGAFFTMIKQMLKKGGRAVITTSSPYATAWLKAQNKETLGYDPNTPYTKMYQLGILDRDRWQMPNFIYTESSPCSGDVNLSAFEQRDIYTRDPGKPWEVHRDKFQELPSEMRKKVQAVLGEPQHKQWNKIKSGLVTVMTNWTNLYTVTTLPALLEQHGFTVEMTFVTDQRGHLTHSDNFLKEKNPEAAALQVGIIVRYDG